MSVLLRHPAIVPTLFSRAVEVETPAPRRAVGWRRLLASVPSAAPSLGLASAWVTAAVIDLALVRAAIAAVGFAPH